MSEIGSCTNLTMIIQNTPDEGLTGLLNALTKLIDTLVRYFGPWGTLSIVAVVFIIFFVWRLYQERQKDKYTDLLLKEKDTTIQRLTQIEREYRVLIFQNQFGWNDQQIRDFVLKNRFSNDVEARLALERTSGAHQRQETKGKERSSKRWLPRRWRRGEE